MVSIATQILFFLFHSVALDCTSVPAGERQLPLNPPLVPPLVVSIKFGMSLGGVSAQAFVNQANAVFGKTSALLYGSGGWGFEFSRARHFFLRKPFEASH